MKLFHRVRKIAGDATLLAAIAFSPATLAQEELKEKERQERREAGLEQSAVQREQALQERNKFQAQMRSARETRRREHRENGDTPHPRRRAQAGSPGPNHGLNARRRWNQANPQAGYAEHARRRWHSANTPLMRARPNSPEVGPLRPARPRRP